MIAYYTSPLGMLCIEMEEDCVVSIRFLHEHEHIASNPEDHTESLALKQLVQELDDYFRGKHENFTICTKPKGTHFQQRVWSVLQTIPISTTVTYKDIATMIGHAKAYRAVGTAIGKNPLTIVIPCHRVVAQHGVGGYNGGINRKIWLLEHEKRCDRE